MFRLVRKLKTLKKVIREFNNHALALLIHALSYPLSKVNQAPYFQKQKTQFDPQLKQSNARLMPGSTFFKDKYCKKKLVVELQGKKA